ncbi:MAG: glycerol-3-phosphate 1-O-acyltransferase PlsY [Candidatus Omnitrophica bacterium]|nr:glycerol-3-phosphate 1-O-acyltransferase PlsY [Candidatus Omnitrophota bacterium]
MSPAVIVLTVLGAYGLGSIPFGLLVARQVKGIDLREHGSKNIGATNVFRVVGKKWGVAVFVLDALKGYLAVRLPELFGAPAAGSLVWPLITGVVAILGHTFPVWLRFKGGKGVATSLGVFLGLAWLPTLIAFGIWSGTLALTRIISISSLIAAFFFPAWVFIFIPEQAGRPVLLPVSAVLVVFIFYTHRANIRRLFQGTEKKIF